ncbi:triose-phosphate isomerase [Catenisphaera adipataccumulans]|uniref:Triosephosphate isomerase n=1 Tax=Catenisphaera adipataccumulans TaxID=700500 RepID=A0A7W8FUY0_9FIRM|nr:triose-phosphate isomerase [Catenisphaera adipataccumulans]MBB5183039.1 triosephosphate isomerase [Catenisphaera adipataccumulans]
MSTGPFLVVNPKNYLYGKESLDLALASDQVAKDLGITIYFTCPHCDIRLIKENTKYITVTAQNMDPLRPGRGEGKILAEALKEAGAGAVFLNHAEHPKTLTDLYNTIKRAKEVGITSIACADSMDEARAVACLHPDIIIAEPTDLIGTGKTAPASYTTDVAKALHDIDPSVQPMTASGVHSAEDCYRIVSLGCDGTGATSGILKAPDPKKEVRLWAEAILKAYNERTGK